jgi:hypothetical protein
MQFELLGGIDSWQRTEFERVVDHAQGIGLGGGLMGPKNSKRIKFEAEK